MIAELWEADNNQRQGEFHGILRCLTPRLILSVSFRSSLISCPGKPLPIIFPSRLVRMMRVAAQRLVIVPLPEQRSIRSQDWLDVIHLRGWHQPALFVRSEHRAVCLR